MQCSCGAPTRSAHYQKTVRGVTRYATQEICTGCGRASRIRAVKTWEEILTQSINSGEHHVNHTNQDIH